MRVLTISGAVAFVLFALTVTYVNPFSFASTSMRALHLLPMLGFVVVFAVVLVAALVVQMMGEAELARTTLITGMFGVMVLALAVSNVFRAPILSAVGAREGGRLADATAEEKEAYERVAFTPQTVGHLGDFLFPRDEPVVRAAFYRSYLRAFESRYYLLVDRDQQEEEGYELGYSRGKVAGGKAAVRNEQMEEDPADPTILTGLRETELPSFMEGFETGYEDGWRAGYIALRD